jgi:hypothetical protein
MEFRNCSKLKQKDLSCKDYSTTETIVIQCGFKGRNTSYWSVDRISKLVGSAADHFDRRDVEYDVDLFERLRPQFLTRHG